VNQRFFRSKTKWGAYGLGLVVVDRVSAHYLGFHIIPDELVVAVVIGLVAFTQWAVRDAISKGAAADGPKLLRTRKPRPSGPEVMTVRPAHIPEDDDTVAWSDDIEGEETTEEQHRKEMMMRALRGD
jgi:hypothetical protein